jgi:hypothetical protein
MVLHINSTARARNYKGQIVGKKKNLEMFHSSTHTKQNQCQEEEKIDDEKEI